MSDNAKLTPKQEKFAQLYVQTGNATQSFINAGYKSKNNESARAMASQLLTKPNVGAYIQNLRQKASESAEMSLKDIVREIEKIAKADLNDVAEIDESGDLKIRPKIDLNLLDGLSISNSHSATKDGYSKSHSFSVKKSDKLKALVELAKIKGAYDNDDEGGTGRNIQRSNRRFLDALGRVRKGLPDGGKPGAEK